MKQTLSALVLFAFCSLAIPAFVHLIPTVSPTALELPQTLSPLVPQATTPPDKPSEEQAIIRVQDAASGEILEIPVLEYMIGAAASEMPVTWPDEALKAQAVAAHSYALYQRSQVIANGQEDAGWFTVEPARRLGYMSREVLQQYWGEAFEENYQRLEQLFAPLCDTVLLYEGQPAAACYHAISNGRTESSGQVWNQELPYLQGVESSVDKGAEGYSVTVDYTAQQMYDMLAFQVPGANLEGDPSQWFGESEWTDAGYIKRLQVGGVFISGPQLRSIMGLRSSCFSIQYDGEKFSVTTLGYGHGVGLSQTGAAAMAEQGQTFEQILSWYFPGTSLGQAN